MQAASHHQAPPRHLSQAQIRRLTIKTRPAGRRATVALDAFPALPILTSALRNDEYWAAKAREHIIVLEAALLLHKQLTSGVEVPRSLAAALRAGQKEAAARIENAIIRHTKNGGTLEAELRQAWEQAA